MILLDASKPGDADRFRRVILNGQEQKWVTRVWALWNGGPGVIERVYTVQTLIRPVDGEIRHTLHCGLVRLEN